MSGSSEFTHDYSTGDRDLDDEVADAQDAIESCVNENCEEGDDNCRLSCEDDYFDNN